MTHVDSDHGLRQLFSRMRDEDRVHLPPFKTATVVPARSRSLLHVALLGGAAAAAVVSTLILSDYQRSAAERERTRTELQRRVFAGTAWTSPTDFLLDTSTRELLRTVPTFGSARWINTDSTSLQTRNRS
jgi:hypothetical protein